MAVVIDLVCCMVVFQISSSELAQCLGLSVGTLYRVKQPIPPPLPPAPQPPHNEEEPQPEISVDQTAEGSSRGKPQQSSTCMPCLPPRKRIRIMPSEEYAEMMDESVARETSDADEPEVKPIPPVAFVPSAGSSAASELLTICGLAAKLNGSGGGMVPVVNGGAAAAAMPKPRLSVPTPARTIVPTAPHVSMTPRPGFATRQAAPAAAPKRGRKPKQMMSLLRPDIKAAAAVAAANSAAAPVVPAPGRFRSGIPSRPHPIQPSAAFRRKSRRLPHPRQPRPSPAT